MIIRLRRGLEANRMLFTPALGEPFFTYDTKKLYVGDGVTPGGIPVDTNSGGGGSAGDGIDAEHRANTSNPHQVTKEQVGLSNVPNTDFTAAVASNTAKRSYPVSAENKLATIASGATANSTDAQLRNRSSHTGTQSIDTISDLQTALNSKQAAGNYATSADVDISLSSKLDRADSSTDRGIVLFSGTAGNELQSSEATISETGNLETTGFIESTFLIGSPVVVVDEIGEYYIDGGVLIDGVRLKDGLVNGRDVIIDGAKLDTIESGAQVNAVTSVNGQTGAVTVSGGEGGGGVTDHGQLSGLGDDDHTQYLNNTRGDTRYYQKSEVDTQLAGKSPTSHNHDSTYAPIIHTHPIADIAATGGTTESFLKKDGTWATPTNTTYAVPTQGEAELGTATAARAFSAQRVNQAIQALAPVKPADLTSKYDKTGGTISGNVEVTGNLTKSGAKVATLDTNNELPGNQVDYSKRYTCILRRNTNQSILNGTVTAIQFNAAALLDPYGWHSPTVQNSRVTVNKTGLYRFLGYVQWFDGGGGYRIASIRVNGTLEPASHRAAPDSGGRASNSFAFYHSLNAGDFVEFLAHHGSGATLSMTTAFLEVTLMD